MTYEGYHPANLNLQPYPHDAVIELAAHGVRLGILFHIDGIPFGADYDRRPSEAPILGPEYETELGGAGGTAGIDTTRIDW